MGNYQGNELTSNSLGNTQPKSSQLVEPLWTDPGLESGIGECELMSVLEEGTRGHRLVLVSPKSLHARKNGPTKATNLIVTSVITELVVSLDRLPHECKKGNSWLLG